MQWNLFQQLLSITGLSPSQNLLQKSKLKNVPMLEVNDPCKKFHYICANSCFPCLEKWTFKFSISPGSWQSCSSMWYSISVWKRQRNTSCWRQQSYYSKKKHIGRYHILSFYTHLKHASSLSESTIEVSSFCCQNRTQIYDTKVNHALTISQWIWVVLWILFWILNIFYSQKTKKLFQWTWIMQLNKICAIILYNIFSSVATIHLSFLLVWVSHAREQHMQFFMRMFQTYFGWNLCIVVHFILQYVWIFCVNQQLHF